jgi:aminopeptidase YwaD
MKDVDGEALLDHAGEVIELRVDSQCNPTSGEQLVARKTGSASGRAVVCAHIDTTPGTPGALDNGTGVSVLRILAEILRDRETGPDVELVPFNGEDNYAAPGQLRWLEANEGHLDDIIVAINIDAAACKGQRTAVSLYGCPDPLAGSLRDEIVARDDFFEGPQWPSSDHSIFAMRGHPAVAITSENFAELCAEITHTERDTPDLADAGMVVRIARFIADVIATLE